MNPTSSHPNYSDGEGDHSSSNYMGGPDVPAGVARRRRGWAGEELELDHRREQLREQSDATESFAAVDLRQFQNTEVGKGYQARHVIRQRSGPSEKEAVKIHDMSGPYKEKPKKNKKEKKKKRDRDGSNETEKRDQGAEKYLRCEGLRNFRIEIEKILSSAS